MRRIFSIFFLLITFSYSATYYVDKNPSCFLFLCTVCDGNSVISLEITDTIKDAIDASSSGDTIKICPGKYNESNLFIDKDLEINSTTLNPDDVIVYDNNGNEIFIYSGNRNNIVLSGITIKQNSDTTALYIDQGKNFSFNKLKIVSKGDGIRQEGGTFQKSTFDNIEINASNNGIVTYYPEKFILKNSKIYAKDWSFYAKEPKGYIRLLESEFHSKNSAVWLGNQSQNYKVDGCKFYVENDSAGGISFDKASDFKVYNSYFNANNKGSGIWINATISGDFILRDSYFENMKYEALYFKEVQGDIKILGNYFDTYSYGVRISSCSNGDYIKDNIFKDGKEYGLWLLDDFKWRSFDIYYNCFINNENQANSRDRNADFDNGSIGNYWSDEPGAKKYEVPDVPRYDNYPQSDCVVLTNAFINYHMDECKWDDDNTTYEIKNFGTGGNDYNASAKNGADTVSDGVICRGGNIINDYYLFPKKPIELGKRYTINMWLKFPLNDNAHNDDNGYKFFNIADRNGSSEDFIYFTLTPSGNWVWNVENGLHWNEFPDDLDGWHMLSFVVNSSSTKLYIDGKYENRIDYAVTDDNLSILFNSDYDTGNGPYGQSIGGVVDEFKIFKRVLRVADIMKIYLKEKEGYDYKGENRTCNICYPPTPLAEWRMDECEWDSDINTFEIKDELNEYNATAVNGANTIKAKLCRGGDLNGTFTENNKYIKLQDYPDLNDTWSFVGWVNFPLNDDNHKDISGKYYFVLGSVDGDGDLAYFAKDTSNGNFYFGVYDNNGNTEEKEIDNVDSGWHHIGVVSTGSETILYIDAEEITRIGIHTKGKVKYIGTSTDYSDEKTIGSIMDEVKLYDGILSGGDVYDIFNNENQGKNADGTNRNCPNCEFNFLFDAREVGSDYNETNISTKIVNEEFNLTIASYDENKSALKEFNGTVCVEIIDNDDNNLTPWKKMDEFLENVEESNWTNIKIDRAVKIAKVKILWKKDVNESCPVSEDINETNSSDTFAIRPDKFLITNIPSAISAGSEFNITVKALDAESNPAKDYNETLSLSVSPKIEFNETKSGCLKGVLSIVKGGEFKDGEANVTLKYSEIGDVNITVLEVNGSEFAITDSKDNVSLDNRFISKAMAEGVKFSVNHFKVNANLKNYDNFTYLDENLNIYALLDINITAENEDNETVRNFNKECYAEDIDINITFDINFYNPSIEVNKTVFYIKDIYNSKTAVFERNLLNNKGFVSFEYNLSEFNTDNNGSTFAKVFLNFDRNLSFFSNPFRISIKDVNVSSNGVGRTLADKNGNATFYYGYMLVDDIITKRDEINNSFKIVFYDENSSDSLLISSDEIAFNLYKNTLHSAKDGNFSLKEILISKDYIASSDNNITSDFDINLSDVENGEINISIKRNSGVNFAVVHILSPNLKWLWYSKFHNEYNYSEGSSCLNHFCFSITYENTSSSGSEVGSGQFLGTESNITEENSTKKGVKIFR